MPGMTFVVERSTLNRRFDVSFARGSLLSSSEAIKTAPLEDFLTDIRYGTSVRSESDPTGTPVLRMGNIQDGEIDFSDLKYAPLNERDKVRWGLQPGDVLVNRTNTGELVGKSAIFRRVGDWAFASYLIRLRVDPSRLDPEFLVLWLNSAHGRRQIDSFSRQSAGMTNINSQEIRGISVPVLPVENQRAMVSDVLATRRAVARATQNATRVQKAIDHDISDLLGIYLKTEERRRYYAVKREEFASGGRMDAAYMHPERLRALSAIDRGTYSVVRLKTVITIRKDRSSTPRPQLGLASVATNTGLLIPEVPSPPAPSPQKFFRGDILIARLRPALNKVWLSTKKGFCSPEFRVLIPSDARDAAYIALILRSSIVVSQTSHAVTGNTLPRISDADLLDVRIPWPEPNQRALIVDRITAQERSMLQDLREARELYLAALQEFVTKLDLT